jgi:hypothetical protein
MGFFPSNLFSWLFPCPLVVSSHACPDQFPVKYLVLPKYLLQISRGFLSFSLSCFLWADLWTPATLVSWNPQLYHFTSGSLPVLPGFSSVPWPGNHVKIVSQVMLGLTFFVSHPSGITLQHGLIFSILKTVISYVLSDVLYLVISGWELN